MIGKINAEKDSITQLGNKNIFCNITSKLSPLFHCPILLSEHFQLWLLAESTVGSLINQDNAIFLQLDITDNLAYALMNLVNIFSSEKIMLNSPLIKIKEPLFTQISEKLHKNLLQTNLKIDLVTSQYDWNSPLIACSAIKQGIYDGNLIKDRIN